MFRNSINLSKYRQGVYGIINRNSGRIYIGSAKSLAARFDLVHGKHASRDMQRDFDSDQNCLEFVVIDECQSLDDKSRLGKEQFWMDFYQAYDSSIGYNTHIFSDSAIGHKKCPESRKVLSDSHKGKPHPWLRKSIIKMDMSGKEIERFESITSASKHCGFSRPNGNICSAANGNQKSAYGYKWKYA